MIPAFSLPRFGFPASVKVNAAADESGAPEAGGTALRVLVVEDDFLAAADAEAGLNDAGFDVVGVARSAAEALKIAQEEKPDLAVMDIRLNGTRDGIDAAIDLFKELGIRSVFATAHHDTAMRTRAQPAAPLGWLPKPYSIRSLVTTVKAAAAELGRPRN